MIAESPTAAKVMWQRTPTQIPSMAAMPCRLPPRAV